MIEFLKVLDKINLLSLLNLRYLAASLYKNGINIMMLLDFAGKAYGDRTALVDDKETLGYKGLADQSEKLAHALKIHYRLKEGQKAGFLCNNDASFIKAVFAVSRLGLDVYLLNTGMSKTQFNRLMECHNFDFLVYDEEMAPVVEQFSYAGHRMVSGQVNLLTEQTRIRRKLPRSSSGSIMLLTGGTTGESKKVAHKPSLSNYLSPFVALLTRLKLLSCSSIYVATPIYHGYGIAILLSSVALGKKVVISRHFEATKACRLVAVHQVEAVTVVPLMVRRMLDAGAEELKCLRCIASGGAELDSRLVDKVFRELGPVLYNLYGTSETGLNIIATPEDLRYSAKTLGQVIDGLELKLLNASGEEIGEGKIGQFCIKNKWSMSNADHAWIKTGDLGYRDHKGYYFYCGRTDDLVVSGGEKVYPIELERLLLRHPEVKDAAVVGVSDEQFGQRLKAFVQPKNKGVLNETSLISWLKANATRSHVPKEIVILDLLPYTPLGKPDKKQLV
ncbi:AMP-dependent synthetase [Planococcus salinus]|uniref:AMP-dependent synthetase n=1 Tax=Planococcus salinus TaxID=1848460 RepID=A0A3M8PC31_9BACL|nr:AMP-dependent synthetase [Planococcus salinus]